jgi:hypothetical protein
MEMNMTLAEAGARVGLSPNEISCVLATYVRSILSGNSPVDRYVNGDRRALSSEQYAGLQINSCRFPSSGNSTKSS